MRPRTRSTTRATPWPEPTAKSSCVACEAPDWAVGLAHDAYQVLDILLVPNVGVFGLDYELTGAPLRSVVVLADPLLSVS